MHPLLRLDFVPATSNERILPPEQPIKASLISGFDRAATVLHILRVWEWTWPPMIIDKTVRTERERGVGQESTLQQTDMLAAHQTKSASWLRFILGGCIIKGYIEVFFFSAWLRVCLHALLY